MSPHDEDQRHEQLPDTNQSPQGTIPTKRKRRDARACASCRRSKVKCEGDHPCRRCAHMNTECVYPDIFKDPTTERIDALEAEVYALKSAMSSSLALQDTGRPLVSSTPRHPIPTDDQEASNSVASSSPYFPIRGSDATFTDNSLTTRVHPYLESDHGRLPAIRPYMFQYNPDNIVNSVQKRLISDYQARQWFHSFFSGSHILVPVFCLEYDTYDSIFSRSAFLFDAIIMVGCRIEEGSSSPLYLKAQSQIREHLTCITLRLNVESHAILEIVQALLVIASYSENGWLLTTFSLRFALHAALQNSIEALMTKIAERNEGGGTAVDEREKYLFRAARVWYGAINLEHIFSLDGEKPPSITCSHPHQIRTLIYHPERTVIDFRLFSQVELNFLRANAHSQLHHCWQSTSGVDMEEQLRIVLRDARISLDVWSREWRNIIQSHRAEYPVETDIHLALLNLQIQNSWALITLHIKAVSNTGIENIAMMTEFQKYIVGIAKEEAVRHLQLLLQTSPTGPSSDVFHDHSNIESVIHPQSLYLAGFKWTMDFVWAKCAFSILLVLRLALLLRDPPDRLIQLLHDAQEVLEQLKGVSTGNASYLQILQASVDKCKKALQEWMSHNSGSVNGIPDQSLDYLTTGKQGPNAETEFEGYAPKEFLFEWHFPGLNIRHVPLQWHDLFMDIGQIF